VNELERLSSLGIVTREAPSQGPGPLYRAASRARMWRVARELVRETAAPRSILEDALVGLPGLDLAFIYGSIAADEARPDSDVDLLIVGSNLDQTAIARETLEAAALLGREVNVTSQTPDQLRARVRAGTRFSRNVLGGRKQWVLGNESQLTRLLA
jgi:predicted nucleotidyltransferase